MPELPYGVVMMISQFVAAATAGAARVIDVPVALTTNPLALTTVFPNAIAVVPDRKLPVRTRLLPPVIGPEGLETAERLGGGVTNVNRSAVVIADDEPLD